MGSRMRPAPSGATHKARLTARRPASEAALIAARSGPLVWLRRLPSLRYSAGGLMSSAGRRQGSRSRASYVRTMTVSRSSHEAVAFPCHSREVLNVLPAWVVFFAAFTLHPRAGGTPLPVALATVAKASQDRSRIGAWGAGMERA